MRWNTKALSLVAAGAMVYAGAANAIQKPAAETYRAIPERNLFGLKTPEPEPTPQQPAPTLPKLVLTGITTVLDTKRALILGPGLADGASGKATDRSFILTEGQREDYVEVLEINENTDTVMIRNCGVPMTLSFDKDGPRLPNTPAPDAPPTPQVAANQAGPGAIPPVPQPLAMAPGMRQIPTRGYQYPAAIPPAPPFAGGETNAAAQQATMPAPQPQLPTVEVPQSSSLTPDEQALLLEITRQVRSEEESAPPLPPTGLESSRAYPDQQLNVGTFGSNAPVLPRPPLPQ